MYHGRAAFTSSSRQGTGTEIKPGTADLPTNSTNAKRVKKSRNLQQIMNKKLTKTKTDKDYVGSATPPHNHRQGKKSPDTPVTKRPATR